MKTIITIDVSQVTLRHRMVTMRKYLAIDAGGTSTRAVLLNSSGHCLGYGTAGGGNPVSRGITAALESLSQASMQALGGAPANISGVLLAMAGASMEPPMNLFHERFVELGLCGSVMIESDLLGAFYSGTYQDDGCALIAGTGAVSARIEGAKLVAVADGTGWLLGDNGSGFWLGREVARAVAAELDGRGPRTALTGLVLTELGIELNVAQRSQGRLRAQQQLIVKTYELSPIELSRFAPLVFALPQDAVAGDIAHRAASHLAKTLLAVASSASATGPASTDAGGIARTPGEVCAQPLVFGGSVLTKGRTVAAEVLKQLAAAQPGTAASASMVEDGVVGSAVLVLKRNGIEVDAVVFTRIQDSLAALRG
ncbi:glucosamine kinase [Arthrobacter sp. UYCu511]